MQMNNVPYCAVYKERQWTKAPASCVKEQIVKDTGPMTALQRGQSSLQFRGSGNQGVLAERVDI